MKYTLWRIVQSRYADMAMSGMGSKLAGTRWTRQGIAAVYTSGSLALATLEILAHLNTTKTLPGYQTIKIQGAGIPVTTISPDALPDAWSDFPAPKALQTIGDDWLEKTPETILKVPSAIVPEEYNFILNPAAGYFAELDISDPVPYEINPRIVKAGSA